MVPWRLPCPHLTHHTQNCSDHIHEQKGFAQIIHDMEEQFGSFQRSRAGGKDGIGISGYKCQKNQNNETEQPPSHIYLADLAVIRHTFSAGDPQCLDTTKAHTDQCPNQIDSLSIILFLDYAGDGTQGHPVGPEVLCHTKGGQSHQGYADPLDHKIKQGASQFYASGG